MKTSDVPRYDPTIQTDSCDQPDCRLPDRGFRYNRTTNRATTGPPVCLLGLDAAAAVIVEPDVMLVGAASRVVGKKRRAGEVVEQGLSYSLTVCGRASCSRR